jgi:hypothetical protein
MMMVAVAMRAPDAIAYVLQHGAAAALAKAVSDVDFANRLVVQQKV